MYPYPGLRPFRGNEGHLFYGRHHHVTELLDRLLLHGCAFVIGPSGCGKSSLVRPGLIDVLTSGDVPDRTRLTKSIITRPHTDPFAQFAEEFCNAVPGAPRSEVMDCFLDDHGVCRLFDEYFTNSDRVLLVVDQFEELFSYARMAGRGRASIYVDNLVNLVRRRQSGTYVVFTMRSDFTGDCTAFQGLPELINQTQFLVPPLTLDDYEDIVVGPAEDLGAQIDPGFITQIRDDITLEQQRDYERGFDVLPLVQHFAQRSWIQCCEKACVSPDVDYAEISDDYNNVEISSETYRSIGGLSQSLNKHADQIFSEVKNKLIGYGNTEADVDFLVRTLLCMLSDCREYPYATRRSVRMDELRLSIQYRLKSKGLTFVNLEDGINELIRCFSDQSCCFLYTSERDGVKYLNIGHEALMRQWDRFRQWIALETSDSERWGLLAQQARAWKSEESPLFNDQRVLSTQQWLGDVSPDSAWADRYGGSYAIVDEFLQASERAVDEQRARIASVKKQKRWTRNAVVMVVLLIVIFGAWLVDYQHDREEKIRIGEVVSTAALQSDYGLRMKLLQSAQILPTLQGFAATDDNLIKTLSRLITEGGRIPNARLGPIDSNSPYIWDSAILQSSPSMIMANGEDLIILDTNSFSRRRVSLPIAGNLRQAASAVSGVQDQSCSANGLNQAQWRFVDRFGEEEAESVLTASSSGTVLIWKNIESDSESSAICLGSIGKIREIMFDGTDSGLMTLGFDDSVKLYELSEMSDKGQVSVAVSAAFTHKQNSEGNNQESSTQIVNNAIASSEISGLRVTMRYEETLRKSVRKLVICGADRDCDEIVIDEQAVKETSHSFVNFIGREHLEIAYVIERDSVPRIGVVRFDEASDAWVHGPGISLHRELIVFASTARRKNSRLEFLFGDESGEIYVWRDDVGSLISLGRMQSAVVDLRVDHDTNMVISTDYSGVVAKWDLKLKQSDPALEVSRGGSFQNAPMIFSSNSLIGAYASLDNFDDDDDAVAQNVPIFITYRSLESANTASIRLRMPSNKTILDLAVIPTDDKDNAIFFVTSDNQLRYLQAKDDQNAMEVDFNESTPIEIPDSVLSECRYNEENSRCVVKLVVDEDDPAALYLAITLVAHQKILMYRITPPNPSLDPMFSDVPVLVDLASINSKNLDETAVANKLVVVNSGEYIAVHRSGTLSVFKRKESVYVPLSFRLPNGKCELSIPVFRTYDVAANGNSLVVAAESVAGKLNFWKLEAERNGELENNCLYPYGDFMPGFQYPAAMKLLTSGSNNQLQLLVAQSQERIFNLFIFRESEGMLTDFEQSSLRLHDDYVYSNQSLASVVVRENKLFAGYDDGVWWSWAFGQRAIARMLATLADSFYCLSKIEHRSLLGVNRSENSDLICESTK